jgi:hypothetical protein
MKQLAAENFDNDILRGIRRRVTGFDVVHAQDFVVLTHDLFTMIPAAFERRPARKDPQAD